MLKNLTIKTRLIFVIGFMSVWLFMGGVIGIAALYMANGAMKANYDERLVPVAALDKLARLAAANQYAIAQALTEDPAKVAASLDQVDKRIARIDSLWQEYKAYGATAEESALADKFAANRRKFIDDGAKPAMAALRANDAPRAIAIVHGQMAQLMPPMQADLDALIALKLENAKKEYERNALIYRIVQISCTSGILFGILLGAVVCVWLLRSISRPLDEAVRVAKSVAAGDLTQKIEATSRDEVGQLMRALADMNESLVRIVAQVRNGTETIATASQEIASGNLDLSSRTEMQASSLEETASSMEELTSTVKQNADSASQANQLAESASAVATRGGAVVSEVVETMGAINASAKKIEDIIGVIDSIAFQTNILALNAAVEAARAGEQGRGFAVVATEVRNLAQRSAAAAKEIKALISDSVDKVHNGAKLVDQAGATMAEIVESVDRVTRIMSEITVASREQTSGIEQVNQAIAQMDEGTQQNAALVEEAAAAAESLQDQAATLAQVVSVFKLDGMAMQAASAARPVGRSMPAPRPAAAARRQPAKAVPLKATAPASAPEVRKVANGNGDWEEF